VTQARDSIQCGQGPAPEPPRFFEASLGCSMMILGVSLRWPVKRKMALRGRGPSAEYFAGMITCVRISGMLTSLHLTSSYPNRFYIGINTIACCGLAIFYLVYVSCRSNPPRTRWPWVIAHPGLPQTRTCGHYRIRFLSSWIRCMTKLGSHRACGSKRVTAEQRTEFLPVHRTDVVAAIKPLTPSILDFLTEPVHRF